MNFAGWVPMRRGIVTHLIDRRLSIAEYAVLSLLILLADKETGGYTINVPTLRFFIPELSPDAADRALRSLHEKRYIFRKITLQSTVAYPYWIQGYEPTAGAHKGKRLDLSQVFARKGTSNLRYVSRADEGANERADEPADERADQGADSNDKGEEKSENQESTIPIRIRDGGTPAQSCDVRSKVETRIANSARERAMAHAGGTLALAGRKVPEVPPDADLNTRTSLLSASEADAALDRLAKEIAA